MGELMAGKEKKIAAALAAVNLYLRQEEAAGKLQIPVKEPQGIEFSAWGQSARQEVMTMRNLIQMRVFTRF
mgnify:CR=1 FL=1